MPNAFLRIFAIIITNNYNWNNMIIDLRPKHGYHMDGGSEAINALCGGSEANDAETPPKPEITEEEKQKIAKYEKWIVYDERYVTKNILTIADDKEEFAFLLKFPHLLSLTNYADINACEILLANKRLDKIEEIFDSDLENIFLSDGKEPIFHAMLRVPESYELIMRMIPKITYVNDKMGIFYMHLTPIKQFKMTFFDKCGMYYNQWKFVNDLNASDKLLQIVILAFQQLFDFIDGYTKQYLASQELSTFCAYMDEHIDAMNYVIANLKIGRIEAYPNTHSRTFVDYLLRAKNYKALNTLLDSVIDIVFVPWSNQLFNAIQHRLDNKDFDNKQFIELLLKIISKSNIHEIYDGHGTNLITTLINNFTLEHDIDIKAMSFALVNFDIFEQNIFGKSTFTTANEKLKEKSKMLFPNKYYIDSQIKIENPYNINITTIDFGFSPINILTKTSVGRITGAPSNVLLFTLELCKKYKSIMQVFYSKTSKIGITKDAKYTKEYGAIMYNRKLFYNSMPYVILFYRDAFIYIPDEFEKNIKTSKKRFVVFQIIIYGDNSAHENVLIVDKVKKTIERFDPHGQDAEHGLNGTLHGISVKTFGYKYVHTIGSGVQARDSTGTVYGSAFGDPEGYCVAWSFCVLELRLLYPDFEMNKIVKLLNNYVINRFADDFDIENKPRENYIKFIRYYTANLVNRVEQLGIHGENGNIDKKQLKKEFEKLL